MARPLKNEAAGAIYHIMARGDGGKNAFDDDKDRYDGRIWWRKRMGALAGWRVHTWVLMGNYLQFLLETPEPNLPHHGMGVQPCVEDGIWARRVSGTSCWVWLDQAMTAKPGGPRKKVSHAGGAVRAHNENEAERILGVVGAALDLPQLREELSLLKKSDRRKVICAAVAKGRTAVSNDWLTERLAMGHLSYVSTLVQRMHQGKKEQKILEKYE
jgi:hypothetical protein